MNKHKAKKHKVSNLSPVYTNQAKYQEHETHDLSHWTSKKGLYFKNISFWTSRSGQLTK